jgi:hypothetical protein
MYFDEEMMVSEEEGGNISADTKQEQEQETSWLKSRDPAFLCQYVHDTFKSIQSPDKWGSSPSTYQQLLGRLNALDKNITRGLSTDPEGKIQPDQIEWLDGVRQKIYEYVDRLVDLTAGHSAARDNHLKSIRQKHRKKASDQGKCGICESVLWQDEDVGLPLCLSCLSDDNRKLRKEATTPRFKGLQIVMTPFQRAITGTLINATVSGGHNINEVYGKLKKKYGIDNKEELGIIQLLADLGYPVLKDRVLMDDQEGSGEWIKNYHA